MIKELAYPFDPHLLLRKKKSLRRKLLEGNHLLDKKVAILGGSTTAEVRDMIELFLLNGGIRPAFYESDYNRFYEDALFPNEELEQFAPDIVYIHTTGLNINFRHTLDDSEPTITRILQEEFSRYKEMWDCLLSRFSCAIIQNNFELPSYRLLGNLDCYELHGRTRFITELNRLFSEQARAAKNLYLNDLNYLSAWFGLERWHNKQFWHAYKYAMSYEAIPHLAHSVAAITLAIYGRSRKCLVLDLDNTLWGGVIGDDGLAGIGIGKETAAAEAYSGFQQYIKELKSRGILLAVDSKNDDSNAKEGFSHPDSILQLSDFAEFKANWQPKHENIAEIARTLNLGIDSLVFVDDNPVERDIVQRYAPEVAVPEFGDDVCNYIEVLDKSLLFEPASLSTDDLQRNLFYAQDGGRKDQQLQFDSYDEFLQSLGMVAEIESFVPEYLERITQLTNKTNQFNLTTKRYTYAAIKAAADSTRHITLYGRLADRFGDNGLVSVMIGAIKGDELHLELWLMSCRVLKRGMEAAMMNRLVDKASAAGITSLFGYYSPTPKNAMVSSLFDEFGFERIAQNEQGEVTWKCELSTYRRRTNHIEVK